MTDQNIASAVIDLTVDNDQGSSGTNVATGSSGTPAQKRRGTRRRRRPKGYLNSAGMNNTPIGVHVCDDPIDTVDLLHDDDDGDKGATGNPTILTDYIFNPHDLGFARQDQHRSGSKRPVKPTLKKRKKKPTVAASAAAPAPIVASKIISAPPPPPPLPPARTASTSHKSPTQQNLPTMYRSRASSKGVTEKNAASRQPQEQRPPKIARHADVQAIQSVKTTAVQSKKKQKLLQRQCTQSQYLSATGKSGSVQSKYQQTQMQVQVTSTSTAATSNTPKKQKKKQIAGKEKKRKTADVVSQDAKQDGRSNRKEKRHKASCTDDFETSYRNKQIETVSRNSQGPTLQMLSQKDTAMIMGSAETNRESDNQKKKKRRRYRKENDRNHRHRSSSTTVEINPHMRRPQEGPLRMAHFDHKRKHSEVEIDREREENKLSKASSGETDNKRGKLQKFGHVLDRTERIGHCRNHDPETNQNLKLEKSKPASFENEAHASLNSDIPKLMLQWENDQHL